MKTQPNPLMVRLHGQREQLHERLQDVAGRIRTVEDRAAQAVLDGAAADPVELDRLREERRRVRDQLTILELAVLKARGIRRTG